MKTIRRSALIALLALGAASCSVSSITAPDCEDPAACEYAPTPNGYAPTPNGGPDGSGRGGSPVNTAVRRPWLSTQRVPRAFRGARS